VAFFTLPKIQVRTLKDTVASNAGALFDHDNDKNTNEKDEDGKDNTTPEGHRLTGSQAHTHPPASLLLHPQARSLAVRHVFFQRRPDAHRIGVAALLLPV